MEAEREVKKEATEQEQGQERREAEMPQQDERRQ
jgi:hypothetical protein